MAVRLYTNPLSVNALAAVCLCTVEDVTSFQAFKAEYQAAQTALNKGWDTLDVQEQARRRREYDVRADQYYADLDKNEAWDRLHGFDLCGFGRVESPLCTGCSGGTEDDREIEKILMAQRGFLDTDHSAWFSLQRGKAIAEIVSLHWC